MSLVAGVDSSTQSCKVVIRDAETGALVRSGAAAHPDGTEIDPAHWETALHAAIAAAGGLADVSALSVAAQQHGMVCLDEDGAVVRPALLWNDTRSAAAAAELLDELPGGGAAWAQATGSVPLASFTITKLRWLAEHEPVHADRTATVCLPHDWLTWRLRGLGTSEIATDRSDASGTGYWSPSTNDYRLDLLDLALGRRPQLPRVLAPNEASGASSAGVVLGAGAGDNAAAALGLAIEPGDVVVSIGTSGVASAHSPAPVADGTGLVAGFADATGAFLPLACTLNAARVLTATASILGVDLGQLSELALQAPPGADGLVLVPYFEGERTPNLPNATASFTGLTQRNATPATIARAAVEGLLCGLADGVDALSAMGLVVRRIVLVGGGARSEAVCQIAPQVLGNPVLVPAPGEYVADGAARQAAWALAGSATPPTWAPRTTRTYRGDPHPATRQRYAEAVAQVVRGG